MLRDIPVLFLVSVDISDQNGSSYGMVMNPFFLANLVLIVFW